jgi:hypothetical protein
MTLLLIGVATAVAVGVWAAVNGALPVAMADPTAKQALDRARERGRIARAAIGVLSPVPPSAGPAGPLFPDQDPEAASEEDTFTPDWRPTAG